MKFSTLHELWRLLSFTNYVNIREILVKFYPLSFMAFPGLYPKIVFKNNLNICKVCPTSSVAFTLVIKVVLKN